MSSRVLKIEVQLPEQSPRVAGCVNCLRTRLLGKRGITDLRVADAPDEGSTNGNGAAGNRHGPHRIEIVYNPRLITLAEVEREVRCAQACLAPNLAHVLLGVDGMYSRHCERRIEQALARLPGVVASASYAGGTLRLEFDRSRCPLPEIVTRLDDLGYRVRFDPTLTTRYEPVGPRLIDQVHRSLERAIGALGRAGQYVVSHREVALISLSGLLLAAGATVHWLDGPQWLRIALLLLSAACASSETAREAAATLFSLRIDVDVLMFAAAIGAATLGHWEEGALLLFLFGLGSTGEHLALSRARGAISALASIAPDTAQRLGDDGRLQTVKVEDLQVGDRIVVRPFDRVAVDGEVLEGASAVDQSAITGESLPVEKKTGEPVFAGTMNTEGRLVVRATKPAGETTLAKIVRLVEEAQTTKSPTQLFTDKVEHWYVPAVFIATGALIFVPPLLGGAWDTWFYRSMAFLTAASPCALAIGTPAAVLCGIARAARDGVLIKGGGHLEDLGAVRAVAFDKTGTLTTGKLTLTDVVALDGCAAAEVLELAAAVESTSNHPLATAITRHAVRHGATALAATDVEQRAGMGAIGRVNGHLIAVGKRELIGPADGNSSGNGDAVSAEMNRLASQGKAIVAVGREGKVIGLIALADQPRGNARPVLDRLRSMHIERTYMLTGDHELAARSVAQQVGVDETFAGLLPEQKLEILKGLATRHGPVAMVGDGVNDAPALAQATVGIAMGAAGTDVAMETADVVLMSSDLAKLPQAIALSRFSRKIITQNLFIAIGVILIVAPLAAVGFAKLSIAVLLHEGSTVVVVCNALRLLRRRQER